MKKPNRVRKESEYKVRGASVSNIEVLRELRAMKKIIRERHLRLGYYGDMIFAASEYLNNSACGSEKYNQIQSLEKKLEGLGLSVENTVQIVNLLPSNSAQIALIVGIDEEQENLAEEILELVRLYRN
ncbi:uncharacterized protein LOC136027133 [Artemia franciscana]|uniref:uncharacterized protein LOC136027133 n=1 Tax=Artemia franciscana TaxID=6661 RepID=UPI0032DB9A97